LRERGKNTRRPIQTGRKLSSSWQRERRERERGQAERQREKERYKRERDRKKKSINLIFDLIRNEGERE
jgi:hypothetical protein